MRLLFVIGGGIGNLIQSTPAIKAAAAENHKVDVLIHCNSGRTDVEYLLKIPAIRHLFLHPPKLQYDYQLNGPFTPGHKHNALKIIKPRIHYAQHIPEAKIYYDLVRQIGIKTPLPETEILINFRGPKPKFVDTIAIYPGCKSSWAMKRWDKYDALSKLFPHVAVVGQDEDVFSHGNPAWIKKPWQWKEETQFFKGNLREMACFIAGCKAFIGNDGGLSHVAAATGIPTFVLFGPSSDIKNKPYRKNVNVIAMDLPCRPCQFKADSQGEQIFGDNKSDCPHHMLCMKNMTTDYVYKKIMEILN